MQKQPMLDRRVTAFGTKTQYLAGLSESDQLFFVYGESKSGTTNLRGVVVDFVLDIIIFFRLVFLAGLGDVEMGYLDMTLTPRDSSGMCSRDGLSRYDLHDPG